MWRAAAAAAAAIALAGGCGGDAQHGGPTLPAAAPGVGPDARWRPPSLSPAVARARPVGAMRCSTAARARNGVHIELFAARRVVIVAPGIGIAPPRISEGAYVLSGRCSYPLRTREPTGVVEVERGRRYALGDLFDLWGQPLARDRLGAFHGPVAAYVGGRPWRRDPRAIALGRHAQIVLEVGGYVRPHTGYRFAPGL